ncbi:MAG: SURF1 family protein [Pseudomonadota bacterium]
MRRILPPLIFGLAGTAILLWLGVWQMQRLAWKEAILADIDARILSDPVPVPVMPDPEADRYLPVIETGLITGDELHVLASAKTVGALFRVIAAFEADTGRRLMIDRGYVRPEEKDTPRAPVSATVTGNLHWPDETDSFTPDADPDANIWYARDVAAMAGALGTEPVLIIVRETSETDSSVTPLPVDTVGIPNDHREYAITWFSLAVVWLIMTGYFIWRRLKEERP